MRCYGELTFNNGVSDPLDFCFRHSSIRPLQVRSELERLAKIVATKKPGAAMEIGTCLGGTLFMLCQLASPTATIISLDLPNGPFGGGYTPLQLPLFKKFRRHQQRLHFLRCDSHSAETLASVKGICGSGRLDYLFIDGDHTYEGVKQDFEMYSPLVRAGGVIAFHDVAEASMYYKVDSNVRKFWDEVKKRYAHEEIIEDQKQGWAGIGVLYL